MHNAAQFRGIQRLGPPASQGDGPSTGQRHHCWSSILQEAAPASDTTDRPPIPLELIPSAALCAEEGAILEALYRISGGFWFSPFELVMASLLQFEEKVHRKDLARAESLPLLMPRLLCYVLEHLGFPEEPRLEMRVRCPLVMSV